MPERYPLTVHVPIRGKLLLRIDGTEALHEVGAFQQDVSVAFTPGPGEVSFQFDEEFFEGAVKPRGVGAPTPLSPDWDKSTYDIVLKVLKENALKPPEVLAEAVLNTLNREGRLSA
jgi:hypothetical protein